MRVLIVDDSKTARMQCKRALPSACKTDLMEASNGTQAIEICRTNAIDLMMLDLTMPDTDGYKVLEALKENPARPVTIVMSADIQPQAKERVLALGAIGFVAKPANPEAIEKLLKGAGLA